VPPGIRRQSGLATEMGEELLWGRQLFPHLGQEGGAGHPLADDDAVPQGTQRRQKFGDAPICKWSRFSENTDFYAQVVEFLPGHRRETIIMEGGIDGIAAHPVPDGFGCGQTADTAAQRPAPGQGDKGAGLPVLDRRCEGLFDIRRHRFAQQPLPENGAGQAHQHLAFLLGEWSGKLFHA